MRNDDHSAQRRTALAQHHAGHHSLPTFSHLLGSRLTWRSDRTLCHAHCRLPQPIIAPQPPTRVSTCGRASFQLEAVSWPKSASALPSLKCSTKYRVRTGPCTGRGWHTGTGNEGRRAGACLLGRQLFPCTCLTTSQHVVLIETTKFLPALTEGGRLAVDMVLQQLALSFSQTSPARMHSAAVALWHARRRRPVELHDCFDVVSKAAQTRFTLSNMQLAADAFMCKPLFPDIRL
jgi:hypothetical protein